MCGGGLMSIRDNIIGQDEICNRIEFLTIDSFPKTLMLIGLDGSGKHNIAKFISERFNTEYKDITDSIKLDTIFEIYDSTIPTVYLIDVDKITVKEENVLLKCIEEPPKYAFMVLIAESTNGILKTVLNRCQIWTLCRFSNEFLKNKIKEHNEVKDENLDFLSAILNTPGKIEMNPAMTVLQMKDCAEKIFKYIGTINFANLLKVSNFIAFDRDKNKFDVKIFCDVLIYVITEMYFDDFLSPINYTLYNKTLNLKKSLKIPNVDSKMIFEHYLTDIYSGVQFVKSMNWGD